MTTNQFPSTHCKVCGQRFEPGRYFLKVVDGSKRSWEPVHADCFPLMQDIECLLDEVDRNGPELAAQQFKHCLG